MDLRQLIFPVSEYHNQQQVIRLNILSMSSLMQIQNNPKNYPAAALKAVFEEGLASRAMIAKKCQGMGFGKTNYIKNALKDMLRGDMIAKCGSSYILHEDLLSQIPAEQSRIYKSVSSAARSYRIAKNDAKISGQRREYARVQRAYTSACSQTLKLRPFPNYYNLIYI